MSPQFRPQQIEASLRANGVNWIGLPEYFESIASSNDYLLGSPKSVHGRVCLCDHQTQGKGRLGKQWFSTAGKNLMFSLGWVPSGPLSSEISLLVGVTLADTLKALGVKGVGLKWPNDVLVDGRKLAGVLIESRIRGRQVEIVIGVGLNIWHEANDMETIEQPWTDLKRLGLEGVDRQQVLVNLLTGLARRLEQLEVYGFEPIRRDWLTYHTCQGEIMNYQHRGQTRVGRVVGLDNTGALLFEADGQEFAVNSGEVSRMRTEA